MILSSCRKLIQIATIFVCMFAVGQVSEAAHIVKGDRGANVREVQQLLVAQGYLKDQADGVFGQNTLEAVKAFQKDKHLLINGTVNGKTLHALKKNSPKVQKKIEEISSSQKRVHKEGPTLFEKGARGEDVRALQHKLSINGYSTNGVDGIYGAGTVNAVKSFQKNNQLKVTGVIDKHTKKAIEDQPGVPTKYLKKMNFEATAYSSADPGCGEYTRNGNKLRRGYIAVDPDIIPLGTEVYIEGYGYAVADDTGGAIKGHIIDVAMDTHQEAIQFGRQQVVLYILK